MEKSVKKIVFPHSPSLLLMRLIFFKLIKKVLFLGAVFGPCQTYMMKSFAEIVNG